MKGVPQSTFESVFTTTKSSVRCSNRTRPLRRNLFRGDRDRKKIVGLSFQGRKEHYMDYATIIRLAVLEVVIAHMCIILN